MYTYTYMQLTKYDFLAVTTAFSYVDERITYNLL